MPVASRSPPPRNAHQAVAHRHYLWIFGGEVCAPSGQVRHIVATLTIWIETNHFRKTCRTVSPGWVHVNTILMQTTALTQACHTLH